MKPRAAQRLRDSQGGSYRRAARIAGEGGRRIQVATQDLFGELGGPPLYQLHRGKSPDAAILPAMRLHPVISELLIWLQSRHQEHEVFERIVTYLEDRLDNLGVHRRVKGQESGSGGVAGSAPSKRAVGRA